MSAAHLVLLRHGESVWNSGDRFAGWVDVPLTADGVRRAADVGKSLADAGLVPTAVHTSQLQRAMDTAAEVIGATGADPAIRRSWRLNERHYGAWQGRRREDVLAEVGKERFSEVRRGWSARPPASAQPGSTGVHPELRRLGTAADSAGGHLELRRPGTAADGAGEYSELRRPGITGESLSDVWDRLAPYWHETISADLTPGAVVLVVAHGNSLRPLVKHLDGLGESEIGSLELAVGHPRIYRVEQGDASSTLIER